MHEIHRTALQSLSDQHLGNYLSNYDAGYTGRYSDCTRCTVGSFLSDAAVGVTGQDAQTRIQRYDRYHSRECFFENEELLALRALERGHCHASAIAPTNSDPTQMWHKELRAAVVDEVTRRGGIKTTPVITRSTWQKSGLLKLKAKVLSRFWRA